MTKVQFQLIITIIFFSILFPYAALAGGDNDLEVFIRERAVVLSTSADLDPLVDASTGKKLVLLGEASHGTHEYYIWRDSISRRLIREKGFNFIVVEGDFASLYELNRYVKDLPGAASSARKVLENLSRWPQWMWGNEEIAGLAEWLRNFNKDLPQELKVGFYGMDVYDEWRSKDELLTFLKKENNQVYLQVEKYLSCIAPYAGDSWNYARAVQRGMPDCSAQLQKIVGLMENSRNYFSRISDYDYFFALQNAYVMLNAEKFYRKAVACQDASPWNVRVHHMHETVNRLLALYGENSKAIVWAHNTHVGDARFTEMHLSGIQNIGELSRVHWGPERIFIVGFSTYKGRVLAGSQWGAPMQNTQIAAAGRNSMEYLMKKTGLSAFYLLFDDKDRTHEQFMTPRGHRAVGVVFNPTDEPSQYVNTILPLRYDAFVFFENTRALDALKR